MSDDTRATTGGDLALGCFGLLLLLPLSLWQAYVFATLWGWFVVTTFDLPALSVPVAFGILLLVSMGQRSTSHLDGKKAGEIINHMAAHSLAVTMLFGFAALVRLWAL